jgi:hypothetical protein
MNSQSVPPRYGQKERIENHEERAARNDDEEYHFGDLPVDGTTVLKWV